MSCGARPPARVAPQSVQSLVSLDTPAVTTDTLRWSIPPTDLRDRMIYLSLRVENVAQMTGLNLVVGDGVRSQTFALASTQGQPWITEGDWVGFTIPWTAPTNQIPMDRSRVTDISLRIAGAQVSVARVGTVAEPISRYPHGVLSFTFDDNYDTMITAGAPVLDRYHFPATAYVIIDTLDTPAHATLASLHERQDAGWDIAAHSFTDAHHFARWDTLSPAELEDDIVDSRAWLMANDFHGYDHCAYPGGEYSTEVLAIAERYFASCRTIYQRQREAWPPSDARKLRVFYVTYATPLASAIAAVDEAVASHEWMVVVFHRLVDGAATQSTEWSAAEFATFVDHVASSGIAVETVSTVLAD